MLRLCQRDDKWKDDIIGHSQSTLGGHGCCITSVCMEISKMYPERGFAHYYTPAEAAKDWTYVAVANDPDPKYLSWTQSKEGFRKAGIEFEWRNMGYRPENPMKDPITKEYLTEKEILKKYMKAKNYGVCFRVKTRTGGGHWLAGFGWGLFGQPVMFDPWSKKVLYRPTGYLAPYEKIDGWLLVRKFEN